MRVDRFLTLYFFGPLIRATQRNMGLRIPVLMYHSISDTRENGVHPYYQINTAPKIFEEQMLFLCENDYSVISLSEAVDLLSHDNSITKPTTQPFNHTTPQRKPVVLTFDDGYRDFYTYAFPVLKKHGFTATVFLPTAFIDKTGPGLKGKEHLSWSEIREMQAEGITFGSHTVNHFQLTKLSKNEIKHEVTMSKEIIEAMTGNLVESFSYPYAFPENNKGFILDLKTLIEATGYLNGVTTILGTAGILDDKFLLKRIPVNSFDDSYFFEAKLKGHYNWIHGIQLLKKFL